MKRFLSNSFILSEVFHWTWGVYPWLFSPNFVLEIHVLFWLLWFVFGISFCWCSPMNSFWIQINYERLWSLVVNVSWQICLLWSMSVLLKFICTLILSSCFFEKLPETLLLDPCERGTVKERERAQIIYPLASSCLMNRLTFPERRLMRCQYTGFHHYITPLVKLPWAEPAGHTSHDQSCLVIWKCLCGSDFSHG